MFLSAHRKNCAQNISHLDHRDLFANSVRLHLSWVGIAAKQAHELQTSNANLNLNIFQNANLPPTCKFQTSNANLNFLFQNATLQSTCWPRTLCRSSSQTAAESPDSNPPTANFHLRGQFSKSRKIAPRFLLTGDSLIFLPGCPPFIPPPKPPPP